MSSSDARSEIWQGDRLQRQHEADILEKYIVRELTVFRRLGRKETIVLGIDAPYGRGKSWFLERLSKQLELSHPVARIDAWVDDAVDEPLTAFMAAIDDALAPYLSKSRKLADRMAAVKASALPVMGKLVTGALTKAASKLAGDEIQDQLGNTVEEAVRNAKKDPQDKKDGAAALAMEAALTQLGKEIDNLVDRQGAAMLAAYRQRKLSRSTFLQNMRDLIAGIEQSGGPGKVPLVVVVDELDRCRPSYAIRVLEEIKHFFDVPGVVFLLGLHGDQLSRSVKAVYGSEFDSAEYLRRFFTRRYELRRHSVVELAAAVFLDWGIDESKFLSPDVVVASGYPLTVPRLIGLIIAQWSVTPREIYAVMDALRLFVDGWEHAEPIEPMALLVLIVKMVRDQDWSFVPPDAEQDLIVKGTAFDQLNEPSSQNFSVNNYLKNVSPRAYRPLESVAQERNTHDAALNYLLDVLRSERRARHNRSPGSPLGQSHLTDYIPRLVELARFIQQPNEQLNH